MHLQNKFVKTLFDFEKGQVLPVPSFVYNQFVYEHQHSPYKYFRNNFLLINDYKVQWRS